LKEMSWAGHGHWTSNSFTKMAALWFYTGFTSHFLESCAVPSIQVLPDQYYITDELGL
jgi:hypothetical protein